MIRAMWLKVVGIIILILLFASNLQINNSYLAAAQITKADLFRTPDEVHSYEAVLIFANILGTFDEITLRTTATMDILLDGSNLLPSPLGTTKDLPFVPVPWAPDWYVSTIPGLPSETYREEIGLLRKTWQVRSSVDYKLVVDGEEMVSGSYIVQDAQIEKDLSPLATVMVYDVLSNPDVVSENHGLGPPGWRVDADKAQKILLVALDDKGVSDVTLEYSVTGGSWIALSTTEDPLQTIFNDFTESLNDFLETVRSLPDFPSALEMPSITPSVKILNTDIPAQPAGNFVKFRANATDTDGNRFTTPTGFYHVVNPASSVRILIVDPHVKLWLYQENTESYLELMKQHTSYRLPNSLTNDSSRIAKISDSIKKNGVEPFHNWQLLGKRYDLYIAWPDEKISDLLKTQNEGGFEPTVILLSSLSLGYRNAPIMQWDLRDIKGFDGNTVLDQIISYVKTRHAGLIATHGTLSDWVIWEGCEEDQRIKVGAREHVGSRMPEDLDPMKEKTLSTMLGLPILPLYEYVRDKAAEALCESEEQAGQALGSLPLQVPNVPLDEDFTVLKKNHKVVSDVPDEFPITIPSAISEFGFKAYTEVGWQLSMPKAVALPAWSAVNRTRTFTDQPIDKVSRLVENFTDGVVGSDEFARHYESLNWGLYENYLFLVKGSLSTKNIDAEIFIPGLGVRPFNLTVDLSKLLGLMPAELVAASKDGLAGIVAYDKYFDSNGYRSVYLSFEVEASSSDIAEKILVNSIEWTTRWQYRDDTVLLGSLVRVPRSTSETYLSSLDSIGLGSMLSDGVLLNEEGYVEIDVLSNGTGPVALLIAHPTTDKVNVTILQGDADVTEVKKVGSDVTQVSLGVSQGLVKLGLTADAESSINPAYVTVLAGEMVISATPMRTTTVTSTTTLTATKTVTTTFVSTVTSTKTAPAKTVTTTATTTLTEATKVTSSTTLTATKTVTSSTTVSQPVGLPAELTYVSLAVAVAAVIAAAIVYTKRRQT